MEALPFNFITWIGILFCISQSAMFSGLNLALLGVSRLRLEVEADSGNPRALKVLALRKDVNFLLTTILWGNVGINVLLTLLSNSVMTGLVAFLFSTILITFVGEIFPQAYFSRHALRMGSLLAPVLRFYQVLLYPVAKPSAKALDRWLGEEGISYFPERDLHAVIRKHIDAKQSDVGKLEGTGAINFLMLDDAAVSQLGERVDPESIVSLPMSQNMPVFPEVGRAADDEFLRQVGRSGKKWVIITDANDRPHLVLNSNTLLRDALFSPSKPKPFHHCHRPIIVEDSNTQLGEVLPNFKIHARRETDKVIESDLILVWDREKRVITGSDILGRLLHNIVERE